MQWDIAGADATREQLEAAGFTVVAERVATDELNDDGEEVPKPFFEARLAE